LGYTCHSIDRSVVNIVLEPVRHEFNISDTQLGLLSGFVFGLTYAVAGLPLGYLLDRVNRTKLLAGTMMLWSLLTLVAGFAQSFSQLLAARMLLGAAESAAHPASLSIISDRFPIRQRTSAMSLFFLSTALGTAAVFIIGSLVVANYGWRMAFFVAGIPGILLSVVVFLTVREPVRGAADGAPGDAPVRSYPPREVLRFGMSQRTYLNVFAALILHAALNTGFGAWIMSLLVRVHGFELAQAGLFVGVTAFVTGILGSGATGFITDHLSKRNILWLAWTPAITAVATALCCIGAAMADSPLVLMGMVIGFELMGRGFQGPGYGMATSVMKPAMRGLSMSAIQVATNLVGVGCGALMVGVLSDLYGGQASLKPALATLSLTGFWAAAHFYAASRTLRLDLERARAPDDAPDVRSQHA